MADAENMPVGHIISAGRGRTGSTFAHWQIGLAYAKYLSPEFHMWCNTVVRRHMERLRGDLVSLDPRVSRSSNPWWMPSEARASGRTCRLHAEWIA